MQNEQLVVDLLPEKSAQVEGGFTFHLHSIRAIKTGADPDGVDEAYLAISPSIGRVNKIWQKSMKTGDVAQINKRVSVPTLGRTSLALFDADTFGADDLIGIVPKPRPFPSASRPLRGKVRLSGSGSIYDLTYSVRA
ncbi:MAG: hypothetical protein Kow00121_21930 [Elainellaceae cyanobacterium]